MSKHSKGDVVVHDQQGDVVRMSGTITEVPATRPYVTQPESTTKPKHAKD